MNHHEPIFRKQTIKFCGFSAGTAPEHWEHPPSVALGPDTVKNGSETRHSKRVQLLYWWEKSAINGGFNGKNQLKMEVLMGKIIELNGGCPLPSGNSKFIPCPHPDSALHMSRQVGQKPTFSMFVQTLLEDVGGTLTLTHMISVNSSNNNNNIKWSSSSSSSSSSSKHHHHHHNPIIPSVAINHCARLRLKRRTQQGSIAIFICCHVLSMWVCVNIRSLKSTA